MAETPYNERLQDQAIRHAILIERHKSFVVNSILSSLRPDLDNIVLRKIEVRLNKLGLGEGRITRRQLSGVRKIIRQATKDAKPAITRAFKSLERAMRDVSGAEVTWQTHTLTSELPEGVSFVFAVPRISTTFITEAPFSGKSLGEWEKVFKGSVTESIRSEINIGVVQGDSVSKIMRRLRGIRSDPTGPGVLGLSSRNMRSIVRTGIGFSTSQSREETFKAFPDIIDRVKIVATLDTRTCTQCMALDGKTFPVGEGPRPPFHINCRCITVPVTKSFKQLGIIGGSNKTFTPSQRAALGGQVAGDVTYPTWLKRQSKSTQDMALGKGKGKLFRSGELKIDEFNDQFGRPMSLERIKELEGLD